MYCLPPIVTLVYCKCRNQFCKVVMRFNNTRGCQTDGAVITGISRHGGKNRTSGPITAIMQFTPQIISVHEPNQINFYLFTHQIDNFNINNCKKSHQYGLNYNTLFWTFTSVASVWSTVRFSKTLESSSRTTKTQSSSEVDTSNLPSYSQVKLLLLVETVEASDHFHFIHSPDAPPARLRASVTVTMV